jgi:DNA-binding NarL/FixJ family response regulator
LGPARVLVVDDFAEWRRVICSILAQDRDFEVIAESSDGLDAVEKSRQLLPNLVLLDIGLPGLNGLEAARRILEVSPETKIVFLSAVKVFDVIREAECVGGGFVLKTQVRKNLLPVVRAILRNESVIRFGVLDECGGNSEE